MATKEFNFDDFERAWTHLGREICHAVYANPKIQKIKHAFQKNKMLTLEEKSEFIDICNKTKYKLIYEKFGKDGSKGYKQFSSQWQSWFQQKGVESEKNRRQKSSVDHILFGSTPDPATFLFHFEEEMLGSMKQNPSA